MQSVEYKVRGGEFLMSDISPENVFTPEDQSEEHKMIAATLLDNLLTGKFIQIKNG